MHYIKLKITLQKSFLLFITRTGLLNNTKVQKLSTKSRAVYANGMQMCSKIRKGKLSNIACNHKVIL